MSLNIAIDYDDTYTADPKLWDAFKTLADERGHNVFCLTKRGILHKGIVMIPTWNVIHTNLEAKKAHCEDMGIKVDIWIDDDPINIYESGKVTHK